jgi:hypothetical protein
VASAGQAFAIYHPDLIMIGLRSLTMGTVSAENPTHYEQTTRVAIMRVTGLEDLPTPALPAGNGHQWDGSRIGT